MRRNNSQYLKIFNRAEASVFREISDELFSQEESRRSIAFDRFDLVPLEFVDKPLRTRIKIASKNAGKLMCTEVPEIFLGYMTFCEGAQYSSIRNILPITPKFASQLKDNELEIAMAHELAHKQQAEEEMADENSEQRFHLRLYRARYAALDPEFANIANISFPPDFDKKAFFEKLTQLANKPGVNVKRNIVSPYGYLEIENDANIRVIKAWVAAGRNIDELRKIMIEKMMYQSGSQTLAVTDHSEQFDRLLAVATAVPKPAKSRDWKGSVTTKTTEIKQGL